MKVLICASTYKRITHGPAKFTNLVLSLNDLYPQIEIRLITPDVDSEVENRIYHLKREYPRGIGLFWEYIDSYKYYKKICDLEYDFKPDVILFVDAVLSYFTAKYYNTAPAIGMINDDEYINSNLKEIKFSKDWLIKFKSRILEKASTRYLDLVVANSNYIKKKIDIVYGVKPPRLERLYKSIDLSQIVMKKESLIDLENKIDILFVKNDYRRGGLFILIEALNLLSEFKFKLIIVGVAQKEKKHILKNTIVKTNIVLDFKGFLPQIEVFKLMKDSDIFCVPSLREGLGVANMEAMAVGIPIVSSNAGGIPEVLDDGNCGWLAKKSDVLDLSNQIKNCIINEKERNIKVNNGRIFVEQNFNHKIMLKSLNRILYKIIENH